MSEWKSTDDTPDWRDSGPVELKKGDTVISANLLVDSLFTGEDEIPLPHVTLPDGSEISFLDYEMWRMV